MKKTVALSIFTLVGLLTLLIVLPQLGDGQSLVPSTQSKVVVLIPSGHSGTSLTAGLADNSTTIIVNDFNALKHISTTHPLLAIVMDKSLLQTVEDEWLTE